MQTFKEDGSNVRRKFTLHGSFKYTASGNAVGVIRDGKTGIVKSITRNAAGDYTVSCQGLTDSQLYYGDKFPLGSVAIRVGISALLGVAGLALLIVLLVRRHLSKSRIRTGQRLASTPMGGPFQAYQPPPGQQYSPAPPPQYPPAQNYPPPAPPDDSGR